MGLSVLGIFWVCSVIVSYSLGIYLGKTLFNKKQKRKKGRRRR
jgi:hypothetical protein|tara:strand:- start:3408 stop:3536 length:129 start_codon:yes stop_codon:yes gene_type:complete